MFYPCLISYILLYSFPFHSIYLIADHLLIIMSCQVMLSKEKLLVIPITVVERKYLLSQTQYIVSTYFLIIMHLGSIFLSWREALGRLG